MSTALSEIIAEAESTLVFTATLEGKPPGLLMHNPDGMNRLDEAKVKAGGARAKKFIPTPEQEAEWGTYRLEDGTLYLPALAVFRSMIEAGKQFKDPARPIASMTRNVAAGIALPDAVGFPLTNADGEVMTDYEIDTRRAVVQRSAINRSRALIRAPWFAEVRFGLDPVSITAEMVTRILVLAGQKSGLLDYRPEKTGPFGRFKVIAAEVITGD